MATTSRQINMYMSNARRACNFTITPNRGTCLTQTLKLPQLPASPFNARCRRWSHSLEGMLGINKNDIELFKTAFRDHPLRRRVDIPDDLHLWSISNRGHNSDKKVINAMEIPMISETQESIPRKFKCDKKDSKVSYPLHLAANSMKTLARRSENWMLNRIALHVGTINEIDADAVVIGTDTTMSLYQLSNQHVYHRSMDTITSSVNPKNIAFNLSHFSKNSSQISALFPGTLESTQRLNSLPESHSNPPSLSSLRNVVHPVGTVQSIDRLNVAARVALLVVQPIRSDQEQYKTCVINVLNEMKDRGYKSIVLPILGISRGSVNEYSAVKWTLESIRDWLSSNKMILNKRENSVERKSENNTEVGSKTFRIILILETTQYWRLVHEMIKIVLCGDRSELVSIQPRMLKYPNEKHKQRASKIVTGEDALKIVKAKERRKREEKNSKKDSVKKSTKRTQTKTNGFKGPSLRNFGDYIPIPQPKIYELRRRTYTNQA